MCGGQNAASLANDSRRAAMTCACGPPIRQSNYSFRSQSNNPAGLRTCSPPSTMSFVAARGAVSSRLLAAHRPHLLPILARRSADSPRTLLNFLRKKRKPTPAEPEPILSQDDLFHPFSKSPFPAIRARGEAIQKLAPCPTCLSEHQGTHAHTKAQPKTVKFECPECGWPTHCSEEHWKADKNHSIYCSKLREVNEDDHDLRSGRRLHEFELPGMWSFMGLIRRIFIRLVRRDIGPQDQEAAISFANWDVFWYTRNFPSMDTERSRRHSSKLLTYPLTIGSVLHQWSPLMLSNQRLTPEGSRSLAGMFHLTWSLFHILHSEFGPFLIPYSTPTHITRTYWDP